MAFRMPSTWVVVVFCVAWAAMALRAALNVRRTGRRWWVWLLVSLPLAGLPATIVAFADEYRRHRRSAGRVAGARRGGPCPNCGARLTPRDVRRVDGQNVCPNCRAVLGDGREA